MSISMTHSSFIISPSYEASYRQSDFHLHIVMLRPNDNIKL